MTEKYFFEIITKRISHGLPIKNIGDDKMKEKMNYALEFHRLLPWCPLVKPRYMFRIIVMKLTLQVPDKIKTSNFIDFYTELECRLRYEKWPAPNIENSKHDSIRIKLQELNAIIQSALDGNISDRIRGTIRIAAREEVRAKIKEIEECKKAAAKIRKAEIKDAAQSQENDQQKCGVIKRIKNAGHKLSQADTETRKKVAEELDKKVHEIYVRWHGKDTEHIEIREYWQILKQIHEETQTAKRKEKREHSANIQNDRSMLPYCVSQKVRLRLNNFQKAYLQKCFGIARFAYNWCLDEFNRQRAEGKKPFGSEITRQFVAISKEQFPFTYEVTSNAKVTGLKAFERAVNNFFNGAGYPQHKRRGLGFGSLFYATSDKRKEKIISDTNPDVPESKSSEKRPYLLIPTLGYVKMMEKLRFHGQLTSVTIKREADGHYYAVCNIYIDADEWARTHKERKVTSDEPIGIDLGVVSLATLSNGIKIARNDGSEALRQKRKALQKRIAHQHECHKTRTSKTQRKNQWQLAKTTAKLRRQREDYLHKVTSALAYTFKNISVENLNVADMIHSDGGACASSIIQACFYKFRVLLEQKMNLKGHNLNIADKYLPTTRVCSECGCIGPKVPLHERIFHCEDCGAVIDRDINAAINLARLIGLGEPNFHSSDKGRLTAALQASGIILQ